MATVQWDRVLETCVRRGTDILLAPGCPILLRMKGSLRSLQLPRLSASETKAMAEELMTPKEALVAIDGHVYVDVRYGDQHTFRLASFDKSLAPFVIVSLLASGPPKHPQWGAELPADVRRRLEWIALSPHAQNPQYRFHEIVDAQEELGRPDLLLVAGSPPLQRLDYGLEALPAPEVRALDLDWIRREFEKPPYGWREYGGYAYGDISHKGGNGVRIHLFNGSAPSAALIIGLPGDDEGKTEPHENPDDIFRRGLRRFG